METQRRFSAPDWDKRYREGFYDGEVEPHDLLRRYRPEIPDGPALDVAMGSGRDTIFLASAGIEAWGVEKSWEAIKLAIQLAEAAGHGIRIVRADGATLPFKKGSFAAVTVFYFLIREGMKPLVELLKPGGVLLYETFLLRQNRIDRQRNPAYLLSDGELISYFPELELLFYEEGIVRAKGKQRAVARYAGRKR